MSTAVILAKQDVPEVDALIALSAQLAFALRASANRQRVAMA